MTDVVGAVVGGLLDAVNAGLAGTPACAPGRVCTVPGTLAWDDCCGTLAVTVDRIYPSAVFPTEAVDSQLVAPCPPAYEAVDMTVTVLRCAPSPNEVGDPVPCAELAAAAEVWAYDVEAVRGAVTCLLGSLADSDVVAEWTLRATDPVGPNGGCVGSTTQVTVGLVACGCPGRL